MRHLAIWAFVFLLIAPHPVGAKTDPPNIDRPAAVAPIPLEMQEARAQTPIPLEIQPQLIVEFQKEPAPPSYAQITATGLRLRAEPNTESDILGVIFYGDTVPILEERGEWLRVPFVDRIGWIHSGYTERVDSVEYARRDLAQAFVEWDVNCDDDNPYNGFVWHGDCLPGVLEKHTDRFAYPSVATGNFAYYDDGVMAMVAGNRGWDLSGYVGGIAVQSCAEVGKTAYFTMSGLTLGPFLIIDCAGYEGLFRNIVYMGLVAEVPYSVYAELQEQGLWSGSGQLCIGSCSGSAVNLLSYWINNVMDFQEQQTPDALNGS